MVLCGAKQKEICEKAKKAFKGFLYDKKTLDCKEAAGKLASADGCNTAKVLAECFPACPKSDVLLSETLYKDVEFWEAVFPRMQPGLLGSSHLMRSILGAPTCCGEELGRRKGAVAGAEASLDDGFYEALEGMAASEETVLSFFQEAEEDIKDLYSMAYFKLNVLRRFNGVPEALTLYNLYRIVASPIVGILSPIVYFLVPYIVVVYKFKIRIGFVEYLRLMWQTMMSADYMSLFGMGGGGSRYQTIQLVSYMFSIVFYFQGLFNSFEISRTLYKISKHVCEKIGRTSAFLKSAAELVSKHWKDEYAAVFGLEGLVPLEQEVGYVQGLPGGSFSLLGNFGRQLEAYMSLSKEAVSSLLKKLYVLGALGSVVRFRKEYGYGYAEFVGGGAPVLKLVGLRHPGIDKDACVGNDLSLGGKVPNNAIITGTNAGGKSVTIKALLVNAVLSQTVGVSCCTAAALTPLAHISSQINVPDSTGHESLFQAELYRCKRSLDTLAGLEGRPSLIVMDEIFSSTNPVEAISGAYAVCEKIAGYGNNILVFTTHLNYLTNLKRGGQFTNYKMDTVVNGEDFKFTYRLVKGVNKHYLALEILKKNGFDADIVERALEVKRKFV